MKRRQFIGSAVGVAAAAVFSSNRLLGQAAPAGPNKSAAMTQQKAPIPPRFRGMTPILPTAVDPRGDIDEASQRNLVRYCLDCGAVAIGHLAFASEFFKLTAKQRRQVIEVTVDEVAGRVPVFIGAAGASNRIAVDYAKEAEDLGADMVMASTPYVTVPDWEGMRSYYADVCAAVKVPVILQDTVPSSATLTAERIVQLSKENPNLRHVKPEGAGFLAKIAKLNELGEGKLDIMGGYGGKHMIHMLRLGVTSFMTGTEAVDLHASVVGAYLAGDEKKAADIYYGKLLPYFMFYEEYSEELLKKMLHMRGIIACPDALKPRAPARMSEAEWKEFLWTLERIPFTPWKTA